MVVVSILIIILLVIIATMSIKLNNLNKKFEDYKESSEDLQDKMTKANNVLSKALSKETSEKLAISAELESRKNCCTCKNPEKCNKKELIAIVEEVKKEKTSKSKTNPKVKSDTTVKKAAKVKVESEENVD